MLPLLLVLPVLPVFSYSAPYPHSSLFRGYRGTSNNRDKIIRSKKMYPSIKRLVESDRMRILVSVRIHGND